MCVEAGPLSVFLTLHIPYFSVLFSFILNLYLFYIPTRVFPRSSPPISSSHFSLSPSHPFFLCFCSGRGSSLMGINKSWHIKL